MIALGLIVATIDNLSAPEESLVDERPVLTPLSFNEFPFSSHNTARRRLYELTNLREKKVLGNAVVPSLKQIMLHYLRVHPEGLRMRDHEDELENRSLYGEYEKAIPFYLHYDEDPIVPLRSRRHYSEPKPRIMYLTAATLIIVPANLLHQWQAEILKHCEDPVRTLVVRDTKPLSIASELASKYDVCIVIYTFFPVYSLLLSTDHFDEPFTYVLRIIKCDYD